MGDCTAGVVLPDEVMVSSAGTAEASFAGEGPGKPPALEAAYQDFKADQLVGLDRMALLLNAGMRAVIVRRAHEIDALPQTPPLAAVAAEPPAPWRLQMASQDLFLAAILLLLALSLTPLHRTRRNLLLQLRGWLDSAVYLLMLMPLPPLGGPLLAVPVTWTLVFRRRPLLYWVIFCVWEPAMFQLSPYLQARVTLVTLVPVSFLCRHYVRGHWPSVLLFAAAFIAGTIAVSAASDLRLRRRFRRMRRGELGAVRHLAAAGDASDGAGGSAASASGGGDGHYYGKPPKFLS
ncbi:hypothetical protein GPECTOR_13g793 [Gonium pectorale]|uniref:Uncharacterized protein n=1 Tax=Gonium pectorale TaxID=33097 RepID=A0A150GN63_GONPE|nr:hypothetical protein GPECTOR_13g793 [Gonium pectorale]|eukprot:KXZ51306.1 hypothetical protein GPECTOR_13g793 [Gonium pectorale]